MTCNDQAIMTAEEVTALMNGQKKYKEKVEFLNFHLDLSKIDVNFTINVLKTILRECSQYKYTNGCEPLYRSLHHSIARLLAMLEVERDSSLLSSLPK